MQPVFVLRIIIVSILIIIIVYIFINVFNKAISKQSNSESSPGTRLCSAALPATTKNRYVCVSFFFPDKLSVSKYWEFPDKKSVRV